MLRDHPERLPLIPDSILRAHKVHEPIDTRFRAAARLKQALWREENDLPIGYHQPPGGSRRKLGSRISTFAGYAGANFLDPHIASVVRRELAYREPGALIDVQRVWSNLLSSMPLTFNLFAPLKLDLALAQRTVAELFPDMAGTVTGVLFEHSPGRGEAAFTADHTAFDVVIQLEGDNGCRRFIAIEMKYSEAMAEPTANLKPRYDELSCSCELFENPAAPELRANPLQQFWREHMLAHTMIGNGFYDEGLFVVIAPELNTQVQRAASAYAGHLNDREDGVGFRRVSLERCLGAIRSAGAEQLADALDARYCDFRPIHELFGEGAAIAHVA